MSVTGKASRYPRTFGLPWVGEAPAQVSRVGLSAPIPLRIDRDPVDTVAGTFVAQRGGATASICQVDWRIEGQSADPVLPEHFQGGVLPSGQVFFAPGVVEVPVSFLVSPGADPARESYGRVLLENLVNCELAAGRGELPLSLLAEPIEIEDAIVSLDVPFSEIDPEDDGPQTPSGYALGPDYSVNWTLQQANSTVSSIVQLANGVELKAGNNPEADAGAIQIWAKTEPAWRNWVLTFSYTWLDGFTETTGAGCFARWGFYRGKGSGGIESNPNLWSAADAGDLTDPTMSLNAAAVVGGVRSVINPINSPNPDRNHQCRMRHYLGPSGNGETDEIAADGNNAFNFTQGTEYKITVTRADNKFTVQKSAAGTTTQTVSFTSQFIDDIDEAWLFLEATQGRRCRFRDLTLVEDDGPEEPTDFTYDWDLTNYRILPTSNGADLWPSTWASNGNTYACFGDGPSGAGEGDVSIGLARFTGSTMSNLAIDYLVGGFNPSVKAKFDPIAGWPSTDGGLHGKCTSLIALGSSLYLWLAQGGSNPKGWEDTRLARINLSNIAAGPTLPSWGIGELQSWVVINPAFIQCGRDFASAWDEYVYALPQHFAPIENQPGDSPSHNPAQFYLIRCLRTANWQTQSNWQWWTGGSDSAPTWGSYANRQPRIVMSGQCDWRPSAFHLPAPIDRCLFTIGRTGDPDFGGGPMSRFAVFMAPRPWHAWTIVDDRQYLATGLLPDLAQRSPIPHTLAIDGDGVATWIDTTWGGGNTDTCITARSTLTPGSDLPGTVWTGPAGVWTGPAGDWTGP